MAVDFDRWEGNLAGRGDPRNPPVIEVPIKPSPRGGSGTYLAADGGGAQWWVKPLNNKQDDASRAVPDAVEDRSLRHRERDDNAQRHVGAFAIYDWCWGGDEQWLYAEPEDRKLYSHDHGWYLPETGPTWDVDALVNRVGEPHDASWSSMGLDSAGIAACAQRLRTLEHDELVATLGGIPKSWPVNDSELERVGWFLESRASEVAARLESMGGAS